MNKQDLRVVKTRKNIKTEFLKMLKANKGDIEKISVTALARQAQINKGTFYLHYQDIYALYNEVRDEFLQELIESMDYFPYLFSNPEEFVNRFISTIQENVEPIDFLWPHHDMALFQPNLNDRILEKIYATCPIQKSVRNDMVMDIIFSSVFRLSFNYMEREPEITMDVLLQIIHVLIQPEE